MRIAKSWSLVHAMVSVACLSTLLNTVGCAKAPKSRKKPPPAKIVWPAVAPSSIHARYLHSLGYGAATLELKSDDSFEFVEGQCVSISKCCGRYKIESGVIVLESDGKPPSSPETPSDLQFEPVVWQTRRLVPIQWDRRIYLIDEDKIVEFCNRINAGDEPRSSSRGWPIFLREDDWDKPVTGKPNLPKKYAEYLVDARFEATVLTQNEYALKLDKGSADGVRVGMQMWAEFHDEYSYTTMMEVVSTETTSAIAEVRGGRWPKSGETVFIGPKTPGS